MYLQHFGLRHPPLGKDIVELHKGRAQAIHARVHGRAAGLDAFAPGDGAHLRAGVVLGDLDLVVLRRTRVALLGTPEPLHDLGHVLG